MDKMNCPNCGKNFGSVSELAKEFKKHNVQLEEDLLWKMTCPCGRRITVLLEADKPKVSGDRLFCQHCNHEVLPEIIQGALAHVRSSPKAIDKIEFHCRKCGKSTFVGLLGTFANDEDAMKAALKKAKNQEN